MSSGEQVLDLEILCVGGSGRSGSTLIGQILGSSDDRVVVGELSNIWERSFRDNQRCDCGEFFRECSFWTAVVDRAFGGFDGIAISHVQELFDSTQRGWHVPLLMWPRLRPPKFRAAIAEYAALLGRLLESIQHVSGGSVLVDSSKSPPHFLTMMEIPGIRCRLVHLVRDSRAVAWSWRRKKRRIDVLETTRYMAQQPPTSVASRWVVKHLLTELLAHRFERTSRLRYEDFAAAPRDQIERVLAELEVGTPDELPFTSQDTIAMPVDHASWGNPSRFERGAVEITPDSEWRDKLSRTDWLVVTAMTFPLLAHYGYLRR